MSSKIKGKAWIFGDNLDVDKHLLPWPLLRTVPSTPEALAPYCMTPIDPDFPKKVKPGDVIVAGKNMGAGHDHHKIQMAMKGCGIGAVIAESFNWNFFRNAIHYGLPVIKHPGIKEKVKEGDELDIDIKNGTIKNIRTGEILNFTPLPDYLIEMIEAGGLYEELTQQIKEGKI
ncbi:MAG: 3-isopropylmalate dehydratase [Candidatus Hodarchaeota archaeon]